MVESLDPGKRNGKNRALHIPFLRIEILALFKVAGGFTPAMIPVLSVNATMLGAAVVAKRPIDLCR